MVAAESFQTETFSLPSSAPRPGAELRLQENTSNSLISAKWPKTGVNRLFINGIYARLRSANEVWSGAFAILHVAQTRDLFRPRK